jgi:carboxypeptidase C (cathepsin A)
MRYMLEHSDIDPNRLTIKDYPGGHMMYLHHPSLEALSKDIVTFIEKGNGDTRRECGAPAR